MLQHALQAAKEGDIDHLRTLFSRHGDVTLWRRLDVLAHIPCDVDPSSYSDLLPSSILPESRNRGGGAAAKEGAAEGLNKGGLRSSEEGVRSPGNPRDGAADDDDAWEDWEEEDDGGDDDDDDTSNAVHGASERGELKNVSEVSSSLPAPPQFFVPSLSPTSVREGGTTPFFWWKGGGVVQPFRPSEGIRHTKSGRDWVEAAEVMQVPRRLLSAPSLFLGFFFCSVFFCDSLRTHIRKTF